MATGQANTGRGIVLCAQLPVHPYKNPKALESFFDKNVAAVILEPIRGEGGDSVPSERYLTEVGKLCKKKGSLLIMDEIFLFLKREVLYKKSCPASSRSRI